MPLALTLERDHDRAFPLEAVAALEEADDVSGIIHLLSGDTDEQRDAIQQQTN